MELDPKAKGGEKFVSSFLRVGEKIYMTDPSDKGFSHAGLAHEHGVLDKITELKQQEPSDVDAGILKFIPPAKLIFLLCSISSHWPFKGSEKLARKKTIETAKNLFPGYKVTGKTL